MDNKNRKKKKRKNIKIKKFFVKAILHSTENFIYKKFQVVLVTVKIVDSVRLPRWHSVIFL